MRALAGLWLALAAAGAGSQSAPTDPLQATLQSIKVPAGEREVLRAEGRGVQIYQCEAKNGVAAWGSPAPEARLFVGNRAVATHGAGPTWRYEDASSVRGEVVARADSPDADSIPLLLLRAVGHGSNQSGLLAKVTFVQRLETKGGKAPREGCDTAHVGAVLKAPYSATYVFFQAEK